MDKCVTTVRLQLAKILRPESCAGTEAKPLIEGIVPRAPLLLTAQWASFIMKFEIAHGIGARWLCFYVILFKLFIIP